MCVCVRLASPQSESNIHYSLAYQLLSHTGCLLGMLTDVICLIKLVKYDQIETKNETVGWLGYYNFVYTIDVYFMPYIYMY